MPGTVLLLAASPAGKGSLVDATSVLPVLAAVAPPVLSGTDTANVVELADPLEPQAVLTWLRGAATAPGPLTVFLTGQLQLDRRQRLPHLALARTTPATVRYTGFPWHWFREELRLRTPGTTTVFADLHADAETWRTRHALSLDCGPRVALYGRVGPPPPRRTRAVPAYTKALATILRSGQRPEPAALHHQALTRAFAKGRTPDALVLSPDEQAPDGSWGAAPTSSRTSPPSPSEPPPTDPHDALTAAVREGRHADAAALAARWEEAAVRERGPGSAEALHWSEVGADLAMLAGDAGRSCRAWLAVADARLDAGQDPEDPAVEAAVDRAHHQWSRMSDLDLACELGPALADLRARVPGRREGALRHVHQRLEELRQAQHVPG
ncbi:hypothetical protein NGF19_15305 [Streptomyces sp. RY43-2]|uniref:Uncharacterized protein n=1 Tax=Streptomyces macrolidinus TaxID=2952607 RepID=A0ABT0ZEY8_9ACTN|nr:hypothetical protein [Streptomyces macrolidinus]MCN9242140.1 hypothetical protein [Streptomyces macrolidinus]